MMMKNYLGAVLILTGTLLGLNTTTAVAEDATKELNLGIMGGQNTTQQIGDNQCVKEYLDKELGVNTHLRNASDYSSIIQGLLGGNIDLVLGMSPSSYASVYLMNPTAVDIVGMMENDSDNSRGYHSVVMVKSDSPYKKLEDLKGKSFGFADPDSTSGYLIPNQAFKEEFGGNIDNKYNGFFSDITFSGGHEQDILGVLNGQFDGAVTWTSMVGDYSTGYSFGAFTRLIKMNYPDLMKNIRIIWVSPLIPNSLILVRHQLPDAYRTKIIAAINKLDKEHHSCFIKSAGGAQHIGPATPEDFKNIIDMKRELTKGSR